MNVQEFETTYTSTALAEQGKTQLANEEYVISSLLVELIKEMRLLRSKL